MPKHKKSKRSNKRRQYKKQSGGVYNKNAGLFSGEQATGPWGSIKVEPTTTNYINNNLKSANPPPQALTQYQGTDRGGNNTQEMPGVVDYTNNKDVNVGPFQMKTVSGGGSRKIKINNSSKKNKNQKKNGKYSKNNTTLKRRMFRIIG
jgi:hypothetical protein